jgi:hypothetical protein
MRTEKQQSAVEWLYDQIENEGKCIYEILEQAKEMEKQRIKDEREEAYNNGYANGQMNAYTN